MSPARRLALSGRTQTLWNYATGAVGASAAAAGEGIRAAIDTFQEVLDANRVDFAAEGLLDGVEDREARRDLLRQLHAAGVPLEELREAVAQNRLALLPVEAVLRGESNYTLEDMAKDAQLDAVVLQRRITALGLGQPQPGTAYNGDALMAARALKEIQEAGVPDSGIDEICRIAGRSLLSVARGIREVFGSAFSEPGDNERDLGLRYAAAGRRMLPVFEPLLRFTLTMQLLHLIRSDVISNTELATGTLPGSQEVTVCFADIADFTRLGQMLAPEGVGDVVRRFEEVVQQKTPRAARHVKTVGDAAVIVSSDPKAVLKAAVELIAAGDDQDGELPQIHAGIAIGRAVTTHGDWYGQPVNLASRLAESAPPGQIYATEQVRDATGARLRYVGMRQPKGINEALPVFSATPAELAH